MDLQYIVQALKRTFRKHDRSQLNTQHEEMNNHMDQAIDLSRFVKAQKRSYKTALKEIRNGFKETHWMWFIFPQIHGLDHSTTSQFYAIQSLDEAKAFLEDPYLGRNLHEICNVLLNLRSSNATEVFGRPDDKKLKSSMTLFSLVSGDDNIYQQVLDKFFDGRRDNRTLRILGFNESDQF